MSQRTALIAGASGLTGSFLLQKLLDAPEYNAVKALVRKPLPITHPKLEQIITRFDDLPELNLQCEDVFCCMGTTIATAGSKEAFRRVDLEIPLALAREARKQGAQHYLLISAMGANEKSMIFYNRIKGELERELRQLDYPGLFIFHPSMLDGPRTENRTGERIGQALMRALDFLIPKNYKIIHVEKVAQSMLQHALQAKSGVHVIPSGEMQ
ncbi:MAG: oxidoreductase [Bacteroidetes bacterium]|nr:oxidoreductase [Bacteroidota bacterium]